MTAPPPLGRLRGAGAGPQSFRPKNDLLNDEVLDDDTRRLLMEDIRRGRMPVSRVLDSTVASPVLGVVTASPVTGVVSATPPAGPPPSVNSFRLGQRGPLTPPVVRSVATGSNGGSTVPPLAAAQQQQQRKAVGVCSPASTPASTAASPAAGSEAAEASLLGVMASRMSFLEKQVAFLQAELKEKNLKLIETRDRLDEATRAVSHGQEERQILANRLAEKNAFIAEHGLTYVGGTSSQSGGTTPRPSSGRSRVSEAPCEVTTEKKFDLWAGAWPGAGASSSIAINTAATDSARRADAHPPAAGAAGAALRRSPRQTVAPRDPGAPAEPQVPFDYAKFLVKCEHLTATVGFVGVSAGDAKPAAAGGAIMARLQHREVVRIVIFADGITVHGGAFRPYGWALCDAFLQDILDGFFPYEYRDKYPDGFPIEVVDRRRESFIAASKEARAQQLQQGAGPYKNIATLVGGRSVGGDADSLAGATVTRAQLLKRLPQQHITATGKMFDIRAGVAAFLSGAAAGGTTATGVSRAGNFRDPSALSNHPGDTAAGMIRIATGAGDAYAAKKASTSGAHLPEAQRATVKLQVCFPDGHRVQLRLYADQTVAAMRDAVLQGLKDHPHLAHALFGSTGDAVRSWAFTLTSVCPRRTWAAADDATTLAGAGFGSSANFYVNVVSSTARPSSAPQSSGWISAS